MKRLVCALSVLIFHQGMMALLYAAGAVSSVPYAITPVGPLAVPRLVDLCFWGGIYGLLFGIALPGLPRRPMWLMGFILGLIAASVGWFIVAPLKGLPPTRTTPVVGSSRPATISIKVLLPQPLGPTTDTNSPGRMSMLSGRNARKGVSVTAPKVLPT